MIKAKTRLFLLLLIFFGISNQSLFASNEEKTYTLRFTGKKVKAKNLSTGHGLLSNCLVKKSLEDCSLIAYLHMLCLKKHGTGTFTPTNRVKHYFNKNEKQFEAYEEKIKKIDFHPNQSSEVCQIIESIVGGDLENYPAKTFHMPTE